jgi:hypothetical protein
MTTMIRERRSRLADWSARLATLSLPVLIIAAVGRRARLLDAEPTYAVIAAAVAVIAAVAAFMAIWRDGRRGAGAAVRGLVIGLLVLTLPAIGAWRIVAYPRLTDISTNPEDPPPFIKALDDRSPDDRRIVDPTPDEIALQESAYPDIVPRHYPVSTARVFDEAKTIVDARRWTVLDARAPSDADETGRIEAVAVTLPFGFRQDVVVVVLPDGDGALVEMRSAARNAAHDLGADVQRIRKFFADLDDALQGVTSE